MGARVPRAERQSARMSEIKNGKLGLYGTEHSKCKHLVILGFKGLNKSSHSVLQQRLTPTSAEQFL